MGLSDGRKSFPIGLAVLIQYRSVTASQPPSQPRRCSYYAQRLGVEPNKTGGLDEDERTVPQVDLYGVTITTHARTWQENGLAACESGAQRIESSSATVL